MQPSGCSDLLYTVVSLDANGQLWDHCELFWAGLKLSTTSETSNRFLPLVFLIASFLVPGCSGAGPAAAPEAAQAAPPTVPPPALVRVQTVRHGQISPQLSAVGTVRPRHFSIIASAADGVVDEFAMEAGDFVKAKAVLSRLRMFSTELALEEERAVLAERQAMYQQTLEPRKEDIEEARAQQLVAEAALDNANRRLQELKTLVARSATNQSAVDDGEDVVTEAKQRLLAATAVFKRVASGVRDEEKQQAKARLLAQEKHVAWLEAEKEKRITRAPFDGFIVSEETYLGQWLSKGAPVARMAMLDEVDVQVPVDQSFISQIQPGAQVWLKVSGTPDPAHEDGRWTGVVEHIVPRSDWETGSRSFPVVVRVNNQMSGSAESPVPALREGMMAEVQFFGTPLEATLVPKDSLVRTSRGTFVFATNPPEAEKPLSVRQVQVEPGISEEGWIQVIGTDLPPDAQVVTEGAERLRPFQTVSILEEAETAEK